MKEIRKIFEKYGIILSDFQIKQFEDFFAVLIETNKYMNLTAITDEREVILKHFLDSCLAEKNFPKNSTVIDVGSGAGFPAIPLKVIRPDLRICMLDSLNKRINFLNAVIEKLHMEDIYAVHARAEDYAKQNREKFDVATARAVAQLNTLSEYLLPFVKVGGYAVIYKSAKLQEELQNAEKAIKILGGKVKKVENFVVEEENLDRNILVLEKIAKTPTKYPRDKNKPKTNPIV